MSAQMETQQGQQSADADWDLASAQYATSIINKFLTQHALEFSVRVDPESRTVQVVDIETNQMIRLMPSHEMQAISRALDKFQSV